MGQDLNVRRGRHLDVQSLTCLELHLVTLGREHEDRPGARPGACSDRCALPSTCDPAEQVDAKIGL